MPRLSIITIWKALCGNASHRAHRKPSAVAGFFLVETLLVLMIFGIVMAMTTSYASNAYRIFLGAQAAAQLRYANDVVQEFVLHYAGEIKNGLSENPDGKSLRITRGSIETVIPIDWVRQENQHVWQIDGNALARIAKLSRRSAPHEASAVRLSLFPQDDNFDNCKDVSKSVQRCRIETVVYRTETILRAPGQPDWVALNAALRLLKSGGGLSLSVDPDAIRFHREDKISDFSKNPFSRAAGILAIRSEQKPQHRPFLDLRYGQMFGTIDIAENGIGNAKSLTASKVVLKHAKSTGSAELAYTNPPSASTLQFTTTGISTDHWEWQTPTVTYKDTRFDKGEVKTENAHLRLPATTHLVIMKKVIDTSPVPGRNELRRNKCDKNTEIAFNPSGHPIYCKNKFWTLFQ